MANIYIFPFSVLETLGFNLLKVKHCSAELNFLVTALVTEIITIMVNTSHKQAVVGLDCPLKINICLGYLEFFCSVGFFT